MLQCHLFWPYRESICENLLSEEIWQHSQNGRTLRTEKKYVLHIVRTFCSGVVQAKKCRATLLYEIASNSSLICSGLWMSSSLEDSGWEEAKASMANTRWTSFSTMRSFCCGTFQKNCSQRSKEHCHHVLSLHLSWGLFCKGYSYHIPIRFSIICPQVFDIGCKPFI